MPANCNRDLTLKRWLIAPGPASRELSISLAKVLSADTINVESRIFPDGESKVTIGNNVYGKNVALIQSTYPPTDRHLFQLLLIAHKLNRSGALVCAVVPYLAYARQDQEFLKGEVVSLATIADLLQSTGVKKLITVDIHSERGLRYFQFPSSSISAIPSIGKYLRSHFKVDNAFSVSPDSGGRLRAQMLAETLSVQFDALSKSRDRKIGEISVGAPSKNVEGKDIILVDDIISTGGSICKAAEKLKELGAKHVYAACSHPLLVGEAEMNLKKAGVEEIIGTNTVPSSVSKVDVAPLLAEHLSSM